MAKKQSTDPKTATLARIRRTEAYAEKVRLLFARTVNEILAINKTMPELDEGVMFSFDGTSAKKREQVETLLRRLHSAATLAIQKGVQAEWAQANAEADKLVQSVLGKEVLGSPQFTAYMQRNTKAMQAFIGRSEHGLNLSQRVWKPVRQLRDEMEVAMTVAIGEGESAADMSRKVRQYLNDPDLMFRRFRYKIGEKDILDEQGNVVGKEPVFGRKWKKRVIDPDTGRHKWIDYDRDSYPTGRGVYKSSAKNAMRVTRTETNIAYRRADNERWQQMDFVIGQRIQLSKNHPKPDICDKLQGEYPKDFQFDGWHPQCFCYVTPITIPPEETQRITEAFLKGEDWRAVRDEIMRGRQITDYPANFKDWVTSHAEDIAIAREQGTAPYFIANNGKAIDGILNPDQAAPATTPAQAKADTLNQLGKAAKAGNLPQEAVDKLQHIAEHGTQEEFERRAATLQAAAQKHAQRTPQQVKAIRNEWQERSVVRRYGDRILQVMSGISDVDTSELSKALQGGNIATIQAEAQKLRDIGKQITALDKLDNPLQVARQTSMATAKQINSNVSRTLFGMPTDLESRKGKLEFEITWMGGEGKRRYPATYQFAQAAYKKELAYVERKIDIKAVADSVDDALAFAATSRSKIIKTLASEMRAMLGSTSTDIAAMQAKASELNKKYKQLLPKPKTATISGTHTIKHETIADLKKRLGAAMPKTLPNLEQAIARYEKTSSYGTIAKRNKAEIEELMQRLFDEHDLGMNVKDSVLESILKSWFKNQFETGTSGGALPTRSLMGKIEPNNCRLEAAHKLFGISDTKSSTLLAKQLERKEYEKYGHLLDHDIVQSMSHNTARQYGNVEVRFKKDKVVATWTAGDSLGQRYQPSLVSDPRSCSFDDLIKTPTSKNTQTSSFVQFERTHISSYLELQYHGELTVDCVESITFPYNLHEASRSKMLTVANKWKAAGVKVYYVDGGTLYQL